MDNQVKSHVYALDISNCPLESFPDTLHMLFRFFPHLKRLDLENCNLTRENLEKKIPVPDLLPNNFPLEYLSLAANPLLSSAQSLIDRVNTHIRCPNIKHLNLGGCIKMAGAGGAPPIFLDKLEHLSLVGCLETEDGQLSFYPESPKLKSLDLYGCRRITDIGVSIIGYKLRTLTHLNLGRCRDVTDLGLRGISTLPFLENLSLSHCRYITEIGVGDIVSGCRTLTRLNLYGCNINIENILKTRHDIPQERESILKNSFNLDCQNDTREHDALIYPNVLVDLGSEMHNQGDLVRAKIYFERAIAIEPTRADALAHLQRIKIKNDTREPDGPVLHCEGDIVRPKIHFERATAIEPTRADARAYMDRIKIETVSSSSRAIRHAVDCVIA